jgi:hypothetical protein
MKLAITHIFAFVAAVAALEAGNRRSINANSSSSSTPFPMPLCNGVVIEDATIGDLQHYMGTGRLTSEQLVRCYIARIDQTNS